MTDLSPAAQAIWVAYLDHSKIDETPADLPALAAALEAAADQPYEVPPWYRGDDCRTYRDGADAQRRQLLAIAAELCGQDQPSSEEH